MYSRRGINDSIASVECLFTSFLRQPSVQRQIEYNNQQVATISSIERTKFAKIELMVSNHVISFLDYPSSFVHVAASKFACNIFGMRNIAYKALLGANSDHPGLNSNTKMIPLPPQQP